MRIWAQIEPDEAKAELIKKGAATRPIGGGAPPVWHTPCWQAPIKPISWLKLKVSPDAIWPASGTSRDKN